MTYHLFYHIVVVVVVISFGPFELINIVFLVQLFILIVCFIVGIDH